MPPLQVALSIAGMVVIIVGAYYVTYYVGVKSSGLSRGRNRNINVVDRFAISKDKSFCIVEIAGKVYIVGVTNHAMTLFDTLDSEDFAKISTQGEAMTRQGTPGGPLGGIKKGLKSFLTNMAGKPPVSYTAADGDDRAGETEQAEPGDKEGEQDRSFESSMQIAREKASERPEEELGAVDE